MALVRLLKKVLCNDALTMISKSTHHPHIWTGGQLAFCTADNCHCSLTETNHQQTLRLRGLPPDNKSQICYSDPMVIAPQELAEEAHRESASLTPFVDHQRKRFIVSEQDGGQNNLHISACQLSINCTEREKSLRGVAKKKVAPRTL